MLPGLGIRRLQEVLAVGREDQAPAVEAFDLDWALRSRGPTEAAETKNRGRDRWVNVIFSAMTVMPS
jgi:hypothetical protein